MIIRELSPQEPVLRYWFDLQKNTLTQYTNDFKTYVKYGPCSSDSDTIQIEKMKILNEKALVSIIKKIPTDMLGLPEGEIIAMLFDDTNYLNIQKKGGR